MKRIAFILVSCVVSLWSMAQTVLWDGEDASITGRNAYGGFWDRCNPSVVDNPDNSGINKSNKCLKFTMTGNDSGQKEVACPFRDWMTLNLNGRRRVSLMIRKATNENVKVQLSDPTNDAAGYWQNAAAWYSGGGKWQKLVFDFSTHTGLNDYPGVIAITGQTGDVTTAEDVWIDNIVVEDLPAVNDTPLKDVAAGTLTGPLTLTGFWAKGESLNLDNGWAKVEYDDFDLLAGKMTSNVTSVDMRGATVQNAYNVFAAVNPNMLIYANQWFAVAGDDYAYIATGEDNPVIYYKPAGNYVGDPMPCYIDGEFKVLYLFEKPQNGETYHPFHMVTSSDLSSFTEQGEVLPTGGADSWDAAPGTGCMVKRGDTYYLFYSGNYLGGRGPADYRQTVLRATSTDGLHWTKDGSWHMQAPENGWHKNEFRDPQVWEENGTWHMVLGAKKWNGSVNMPVVAEYTSTNLTDWTGPMVLVQGTNAANFYECPDVFKTANGTYLVYSEINNSDRKVHYLYKPNGASAWTVPAFDVLDGQGFYAGKTAYDGYDRYIFGWCDRRVGNINENGLAWGGTLVTHKLYEKAAGTLALTVPHKFLTNFGTVGTLKTRETSGTVTLSGGTYTMAENSSVSFGRLKVKNAIEATVTASSNTDEVFAFSFVDNSDRDAVYTIRLNLAHQKIYFNKDGSNSVQEINQVPMPRSDDGVYNIRIYNDQSVCVMYVNDQVAFTNRIYGMPKNPWRMACEHGSVTVSGLTVKN